MMTDLTITPIAYMRSDFPEKFGIPRQAGLVKELVSVIEFVPQYGTEDFFKGLAGEEENRFSHMWLIWGFSANGSSGTRATVRPPRLGGNERLGVWATRSPFRPNPLGLSCVEIRRIFHGEKSMCIEVAGADLMDGTPIYDVKPYVPFSDSIPDAKGGFTTSKSWETLHVEFPEELLLQIPEEKRDALIGVLAEDPRPAYQEDPEREYGLSFGGYNIRFRVEGDTLTVVTVSRETA